MENSAAWLGNCGECGIALARALVREVRRLESLRLLEVTCAFCEHTFLAIDEIRRPAVLDVKDVLAAARALHEARSLSDLFGSLDIDRPRAA